MSIQGRGRQPKECLKIQRSRRRWSTKEDWWEEVGADEDKEENDI